MQPSDFIAIGALVVSVIALWQSIKNDFRDRCILKCEGFLLRSYQGKGKEYSEIGITVLNIGRRPISVIDIYYESEPIPIEGDEGVRIRSQLFGGRPDKLSHVELGENQKHQFMSQKLSEEDILKLPRVIEVIVVDSRGRKYKSRITNEVWEEVSNK